MKKIYLFLLASFLFAYNLSAQTNYGLTANGTSYSASSQLSTYGLYASNVGDNNTATQWVTNSTSTNEWIRASLNSSYEITELKVYCSSNCKLDYFTIQYSTNNGASWYWLNGGISYSPVLNGWKTINVEDVLLTDLRFNINKSPDNNRYSSINEIQIWGDIQQDFTEMTSFNLDAVYHGAIDWGDFDNDGDLDLLITGDQGSSNAQTTIYRNTGNSFSKVTTANLTDVTGGDANWVDYDRDGDLDVCLSGYYSVSPWVTKLFRNNGNSTFTEITGLPFIGVATSSIDWGDYDRDGDLDLLLTGQTFSGEHGNKISKIYNNASGSFSEVTSVSLYPTDNSHTSWADFNNDGFLDIFLVTPGGFDDDPCKVYENNQDGTFSEVTGTNITALSFGSADLGDYDNDGDLDIIINGWNYYAGNCTKIYRNDGNFSFTEMTSISIQAFQTGDVEWGDYDNDGDLDILIGGSISNQYMTQIYKNNGSNSFTLQTQTNLPDAASRFKWGDYDNDGDLDIALMGYTPSGFITKIYRNNCSTSNSRPGYPSLISVTPSGTSMVLSWPNANDDHTNSNSLSYNVQFELSMYGVDIVTPHSNLSNGFVKVPELGNAQLANTFEINNLVPGYTYSYKVQAIDNCFKGSLWKSGSLYLSSSKSGSQVTGLENEIDKIVNIYPNPSNGVSNIQYNGTFDIKIIDLSGKVVLQRDNCEEDIQIDLSSQPSGTYIIQIMNGKETTNHRFIIE